MITAVFTSGFDHTEVSGLWQYDYGQKLRIQGLSLTPAVEIHFSLQKSGGDSESRVGVTKDGVTEVPIPDSMLENGGTVQNYYIYAFIYLTDKDSGKTVKWIQLHVNSRPKPEAFDSPEEKELFREAIAAVNDSADRAETAEKSSEAWAHGREDYPERDEDNAKFYSDKAGEKAEETASNLQEVNNLANQVKENAETVASDKNAVEEFKNKAAESAENADLSEANAAIHENNAKEARTKAETAQRAVEEAKEQVAKDKEEVLIVKTVVEKSEENVAGNKEYVRQTVENFTSFAENAVDAVNTAGQNQVNNIEEAGQSALDNIRNGVDEGLAQSGKAADAKVAGEKFTCLEHDMEELNNKKITKFYASNLGNTNLQDSDSGKITDMKIFGKSEQKSYSGKNLYDSLNYPLVDNKAISSADGSVYTTTTNIWCATSAYIPFSQYVAKSISFTSSATIIAYDVNKNFISRIYNGETVPDNTYYIRFDVKIESKNVMQIELGDTLTDYEPYTGGIPSPNPDYPQEIKSVVNPVVKVLGKNLLDTSKATLEYGKAKIINGEIYLNGTYDSSYDYYLFGSNNEALNIIKKINKTVSISCGSFIVGILKRPGITILGKVIKINPFAENLVSIYVTIPSGTYDNIKLPIIVEIGEVATEYEQYQEQIATLPYTINAIPVSSGGNVEIDGQQYIADYVDVERGKLVRMIGSERVINIKGNIYNRENGAFDIYNWIKNFKLIAGTETVANAICNALPCRKPSKVAECNVGFGFGQSSCLFIFISKDITTLEQLNEYLKNNEIWICSELKKPIEIDLADEEVQAFKDITTYYPVTNAFVSSDQLDGYTEFNYPLNMKNGWDYVMQQIEETRPIIYDTEVKVLENKIDTEILIAMMEG